MSHIPAVCPHDARLIFRKGKSDIQAGWSGFKELQSIWGAARSRTRSISDSKEITTSTVNFACDLRKRKPEDHPRGNQKTYASYAEMGRGQPNLE
jgi:hypothetical protein